MMTGPTILTPITLTFGTPARAHSASKIQRCAGVQSGPAMVHRPARRAPAFLCSARCQAMPMSGSENTEASARWRVSFRREVGRDEVANFLFESALFGA
jgi:hypothetical protein